MTTTRTKTSRKRPCKSPPLRVLESTPRVYLNTSVTSRFLTAPKDVARVTRQIVRREKREVFLVFHLDARHRMMRAEIVSIGTLSASLVHPREVFRGAIRYASAAIVAAHNHPSGQIEPSPDDLELTKRLVKGGELLGIEVLDHVIIGGRRYFSLREEGLM